MKKIETWSFNYTCEHCGDKFLCDKNDIQCEPASTYYRTYNYFIICECGEKYSINHSLIPYSTRERLKNKFHNINEKD